MRTEYDMSHAKRGAIISTSGKSRITLFLDNEIIRYFRDKADKTGMGKGYQTMINECLHEVIHSKPTNPMTNLRRILREELKKALHE